jgi:hypothetical protein
LIADERRNPGPPRRRTQTPPAKGNSPTVNTLSVGSRQKTESKRGIGRRAEGDGARDGQIATAPNCIHAIRTADYKYARYYDPAGVEPDQEEFYDLRPNGGDYDDVHQLPLELKDLSEWAINNFPDPPALTEDQLAGRALLKDRLAAVASDRLQPRPAGTPVGPRDLKIEISRWTDAVGPHERAQITFYSQLGVSYQLQRSTDFVAWTDVDGPIPGNNGPVLRHYELAGVPAFYRISWQGTP